MIFLLILALLLTMIGRFVQQANDYVYTEYHLRKGKHYSYTPTFPFWPLRLQVAKPTMRFEIGFSRGIQDSDNHSGDVNKGYGMRFGMFNVHKHSFRLGWTYDDSVRKVHLYSYIYSDGVRIINHIGSVPCHTSVDVVMFRVADICSIIITDEDSPVGEHHQPVSPITRYIRWKQYPYYGGDLPSPVDALILIRDI
jgi:hypothetical protein